MHDHLVGDRIHDVGTAGTAADTVGEADLDLLATIDDRLVDALRGAAVVHGHDHVLRHVGQLAGEISRVGRLECRVGETLAGTVRGAEVLEHGEAFTEVGLDRRLDNLARRLGHQASHASELPDLLHAASGTRVRHQEDRVHVAGVTRIPGVGVLLEFVHHLLGDLLAGVRPGVKHLVVAFAVGDHAALVELHDLHDVLLRTPDDSPLVGGRDQVVRGEGEAAPRAPTEADAVHVVEQIDRLAATKRLVAVGDYASKFARSHRDIVEEHAFRQDRIEQHAADRRLNDGSGLAERLDVCLQATTG